MRWSVLLVCAAVAAGCDIQVGERGVTSIGITEGRAEDEWTRTYTVQPGGTVEIVNVNGFIEATGGAGNQVDVRAERIVRDHGTDNAEARLKQLQMREEVSAGRVRIEAEPPRQQGILDHSSVTVNYRVTVPSGVAVMLESDNGEIRLDNLAGQVTATTINGAIIGEALSGPLTLDTTNGAIRLDLVAVRGDMKLATVNGGIRLDVGADLKATLDATCVNGGINVDGDLKLQTAETSPRRLAGTFNGGGPGITASTVNGGIRIRARDGRRD
ncbi:MAG: DUF4097 domain-containing protein [Acidimicrobiia bacterium]|nr:DUF4097 domain-containing protein [Acidimicrobiia bacterium]